MDRIKDFDQLRPMSLVSNISKGYSLAEAMDITVKAGFNYIEPASIFGVCEHFLPEQLDEEFAAEFASNLKAKGLNCYAVSGHVDISEEKQCEDFIKKLQFAGRIGAKIINTNSGPIWRRDEFNQSMRKIIPVAEKYGVIVGLESHGDIVSTAKDSGEVFKYFNHELVRMNYDTGNTLFYSEGKAVIENDILYALEYISYLHLKDIRIRGNQVEYCALGQGDVNLAAVIKNIKENLTNLPVGLEIPVQIKGVLGDIRPSQIPLSCEEILAAVDESIGFLAKISE